MKVILIVANPRLGKIGDFVEVRSGYAKNFLIPQKQAICFTENNYKIFASKKQEFEKENAKNIEAASKIKEKIDGKNLIIVQNASDDGRLYGAVNSTLIASELTNLAAVSLITRGQIFLKKPIKEIGVFDALVELNPDVSANVKLVVARSEAEAESLLKTAKEEKREEKLKEQE
jgi:large subunit ribosomal protein L9